MANLFKSLHTQQKFSAFSMHLLYYSLPALLCLGWDIQTACSSSFPSNENQTKQKNDMLAKLRAQGEAETLTVSE